MHLSLAPVHRRGWGSLYAALSKGTIDAETSPERGYLYHPSRHSAGQPIVAGWAYQLVAGLSFERDSWVTPVDAQRVRPEEDANDVAAEQVRTLTRRPTQSSCSPGASSPIGDCRGNVRCRTGH